MNYRKALTLAMTRLLDARDSQSYRKFDLVMIVLRYRGQDEVGLEEQTSHVLGMRLALPVVALPCDVQSSAQDDMTQ